MSPLVARCVLVGASVVLAVVGVLVPIAGAPRAVVFGAAACCAVLDVLVVRGGAQERAAGESATVVVRAPPLAPARTPESPSALSAPGTPGVVVLGAKLDGRPVELGLDGPVHVVVVGCGALAVAVFRAIGAQVRARVTPTDADSDDPASADVRVAGAAEVGISHPPEGGPGPPRRPMPPGTAVLAAFPSDGSEPSTVVLVPAPGATPRQWNAVVEVTRYGCTLRRPGDDRPTTIAPVLPQLGEHA